MATVPDKEKAAASQPASSAAEQKPAARRVLAVIAKGAAPFRRGTYVIPNDRVLVLDESEMDPAHVLSIDEEANIIKFRSTDPFTPESEVERYKQSNPATAPPPK